MSPRPLASEPRVNTPWMNAHEAATHIGFASAKSLYRAVTERIENKAGAPIPVSWCGRSLRFHRGLLDLWLLGATPLELARAAKPSADGPVLSVVGGSR